MAEQRQIQKKILFRKPQRKIYSLLTYAYIASENLALKFELVFYSKSQSATNNG